MFALEKIRNVNILRVYGVTLFLGLAYGISIALTAIHLDEHGFGKEAIGDLATAFALGLVIASVPMGRIIRRFSAKRVLTAGMFGYALCVALFPWITSYGGLAVLRFFDGACSMAVWISCETLLLSLAEPEHKAYTTSLYAISLAVGYVAGPLLARGVVAWAPLSTAFALAGALAASAGLFAALRVSNEGHEEQRAEHAAKGTGSSWPVFWKIKNSCVATFAYGYFQAGVVLFLPLYLMASKNITRDQTVIIPAFFAAGMLLFSNVAGRAGDRFGHLLVMRCLAALGMSMILGFVLLDSYILMCAAVFTAGASLAPISPVSLALQGVQCEQAEYSRATSIYNTFYAAGILLGPLISSRIFARVGGPAMLYHLAAIWAAFIVFSIVFARDDPRSRRTLKKVLSPSP